MTGFPAPPPATHADVLIVGAGIADLIRPNTAAVVVEAPGSQTFEMQDIPAIVRAAHRHGAKVLMDNTWGIHHFQPFEHGVDVSIQARILDLLATLQAETGVALLFISHDLGVIHHISDDIIVMRSGEVVESGAADEVFENPQHPYTRELLAAVPTIDGERVA